MHRRESYDRWRGRRTSMGVPRHSISRRPAQAGSLPTSTATALQELGLILPQQLVARTRRPPRGTWEAVEALPQPVLFLLSFTCFGLLLALLAWHPWR